MNLLEYGGDSGRIPAGPLGNLHHHRAAVDVANGIGAAVHRFIVKLLVAVADGIEIVVAELCPGVAGLGGHGFLRLVRAEAAIVSLSSRGGH